MKFSDIQIQKPDARIEAEIHKNWDQVAKPLDGLGTFEGLLAKIGAILGSGELNIQKKAVIVMCADNGIVEEGVSQSKQEVTSLVTKNMGYGKTSVGKMAGAVKADVIPVDIGINGTQVFEGVVSKKVAMGTKNFLKEPAMTKEEAVSAIRTGIEMVKYCKEQGYQLVGTGEMGIGNTTTSSAMAAAFLGCPVEQITGRGAGLSTEGLLRKEAVIKEALKKYQLTPQTEALYILQTVGGLDIAGLTGVYLGGAIYHIPIVMDGVISAVAALTAERLCPGVKDYIIPSHKSKEPAAGKIMEELGVSPVIDAGLALGEGTGAVMMFSLLDLALCLYQNQTTFGDISLAPYQRFQK